MKLLSFDLEIGKSIPEGRTDWRTLAPLGISCAGLGDGNDVDFFYAPSCLSVAEAGRLVDVIMSKIEQGFVPLTFNGTSFDWNVLAQESGRYHDCAQIAWQSVDLMLIATIQKGWFVGLDSCLSAHGLASKEHRVQLTDGSWISDMSGAKAPELWARGEYGAVLTYLRRDVESQLELARSCQTSGTLQFISKKGVRHFVPATRFCGSLDLMTVREVMQLPLPDQSWMSNPPTKRQFVDWIIDNDAYMSGIVLSAVNK